MAQQQYTTKRRKGQHLTLIERGNVNCNYKCHVMKNIL